MAAANIKKNREDSGNHGLRDKNGQCTTDASPCHGYVLRSSARSLLDTVRVASALDSPRVEAMTHQYRLNETLQAVS